MLARFLRDSATAALPRAGGRKALCLELALSNLHLARAVS